MDEDIRRLERAAATGDPEAVARLHRARQRAGARPNAGEFARLDGARIDRPEATGNWRVCVSVVGTNTLGLTPVSPERASLVKALGDALGDYIEELPVSEHDVESVVTLTLDEFYAARVEFNARLTGPPLRQTCPRCGAAPYFACERPDGEERPTTHKARSTVPHLIPPPPPPAVHVSEGRDRPSIVKVKASRNPHADVRITRSDLAIKARPRISPGAASPPT